MTKQEYDIAIQELEKLASDIIEDKGKAYTNGSDNVLANFYRNAERLNTSPMMVWAVYFNKHVDSVNAFVSNPEVKQGESLDSRFTDLLNYIKLGYAISRHEEYLKRKVV